MTNIPQLIGKLQMCITAEIRTTVPAWRDVAINEATDGVIHRAIHPTTNEAVRYAITYAGFCQNIAEQTSGDE